MIYAVQIAGFLFSLYTIHTYVMTETHSKEHKLLPLVMGLVSVYEFYQIIFSRAQSELIYAVLRDLLIIFIMYLLVFYLHSILHMKIGVLYAKALFFSLVLVVGGMTWDVIRGTDYQAYFITGLVCYDMIVVALAIYSYFRLSFSKREKFIDRLLLIAVFLPGLSVFLRFTHNDLLKNFFMACSLIVSFAIVLYLLKTGRLLDTAAFLHENFFDKSDVPILLFDTDFFFLDANTSARNLFPELYYVSRKKSHNQDLQRVYELSLLPGKTKEIRYAGKYYNCILSEQYAGSRLRGYVVTVIDITRQKEEAERYKRLKKAADKQNEFKSTFLGIISHDMKSPLHAMIEAGNILSQKRELSEHSRTLLSYVKGSGNILLELINTMLEYSKLEDGSLTLNNRTYQMERLLEDLSNISVLNLHSRPVHFMAVIEGEHPENLYGDDIRIREILYNVLENVARLTNRGNISVTIRIIPDQEGQADVIFCIKVYSPDLKKELIQQITEELGNYDKLKETDSYALSLSIIMQIMEMLHGDIRVQSDTEKSLCIMISFQQEVPDGKMVPEITFSTESVLEKEVFETGVFQPEYIYPDAKILVVDDMRINREIFAEQISLWQCEVDRAANGQQAIKAVEEKAYDLIFIDQLMPGMTGIEASVKIKEIQPDCTIIMMTADAQPDIWKAAKAAGIKDYLAKPYDASKLQRILELHLRPELQQISIDKKEAELTKYIPDQKVFRKILKTFYEEISDFEKHMDEYAAKDMESFRVRTHGVKGVCKQLNKLQVGETAEIMEMAAKTGNTIFIANHIESFRAEISCLLEQIKVDLSKIQPEQPDTIVSFDVEELWKKLKEGFDRYDLDQIETMLNSLKKAALAEPQQDILKQAEQYYDDFEYEEGSRLLAEFLR